MNDTVLLHPKDHVAIALRAISSGETITYSADGVESPLTVLHDVP